MLSLVFNITECSNIDLLELYINDYTNSFYKLYSSPNKLSDVTFLKSIQDNTALDMHVFHNSCLNEVKTKLKQSETILKKKIKEIKEVEKLLNDNEFVTKYQKRHKYHLTNKHSELKRNIHKNVTFGGKNNLRDITKLSQSINGLNYQIKTIQNKIVVCDDLNIKKNLQKELSLLFKTVKDKQERLGKVKETFTSNRTLGYYSVGQANQYGNRKFNLDLNNGKVVFKPSKEFKIDIKFDIHGKKRIKTLKQLQEMADLKLIPITIRLTKSTITFMYDESVLNGFKLDEKSIKAEQKDLVDELERKKVYRKYAQELDERKKVNKIWFRYASVDLNPKYIGLCIFDNVNGKQVIIHTQMFDLTRLSPSMGLSSSDVKQVKQNNKRKHEIKETWKQIFEICKHFKVFNFVVEQLVFANKVNNDKSNKELNKQTKNLWHRTLTTNLIEKYCNENGLKLISVNSAYSSFIGNMIHIDYVDPIASAIEIGRRGMTKYLKGNSIYPSMTLINQEKLLSLLGENDDITKDSWVQLYKNIYRKRYRNTLSKDIVLTDKFLGNGKSKVRVVTQ